MPGPFTTFLFDLDGTLIDSRVDLTSAVNHVLRHLGHPSQSVDQVASKVGNGLRELLRDSLSIDDPVILFRAKELFKKLYEKRMLVRLLGVRFSHLVGGGLQINLFEDSEEIINLYQAMDKIRHRYGEDAVKRAVGLKSGLA